MSCERRARGKRTWNWSDGYEATKRIRESENSQRETLEKRGKGTEEIYSDALPLPPPRRAPHFHHRPHRQCHAGGSRQMSGGRDGRSSQQIHSPRRTDCLFNEWLFQQALTTSSMKKSPVSTPIHLLSFHTSHRAVNAQTLRELEDLGGRGFLETMIQKFVENALHCVTLIEQAVDTQNLTQLQKTAHGLKGLAVSWKYGCRLAGQHSPTHRVNLQDRGAGHSGRFGTPTSSRFPTNQKKT